MNALALTMSDLASALRTPLRQSVAIRPFITVISDGIPAYGVTIEGQSYECSERELALLRTGMSPADLELQPWQEDDEPDFTAADRRELLARSGTFGRD